MSLHPDVMALRSHYVMTMSLHFGTMMSLCYDIVTLLYDVITLQYDIINLGCLYLTFSWHYVMMSLLYDLILNYEISTLHYDAIML